MEETDREKIVEILTKQRAERPAIFSVGGVKDNKVFYDVVVVYSCPSVCIEEFIKEGFDVQLDTLTGKSYGGMVVKKKEKKPAVMTELNTSPPQ